MGQYYQLFNLTSKKKVYPRKFDDGIKLMEFAGGSYRTAAALALLLTATAARRGPWAGERIVVSGDYADEGKFVPEAFAHLNLYGLDCAATDGGPSIPGELDEHGHDMTGIEAFAFTEDSALAKSLGKELLPSDNPFNCDGEILGMESLFDDKAVITTIEDCFALFDVPLQEKMEVAVDDVMRVLRCASVPSDLSWNFSPRQASLTFSGDGESIDALTVLYEGRQGVAPCREETLTFPATGKTVRDFFAITGRKGK